MVTTRLDLNRIRRCVRIVYRVGYGAAILSLMLPQVVSAGRYEHPAQGFRVEYPDTWTLNTRMPSDGPMLLTNFPEYRRGGLLPEGGIEITVVSFPAGEDENAILIPQHDAVHVNRTSTSVADRTVLRADYDVPAPYPVRATPYRATSITLRADDKLIRIVVQYEHAQPSDKERAEVEKVLTTLITSVTTMKRK